MHWCVYISVRSSWSEGLRICEFVLARKEEMESGIKLGYSATASTYTENRSRSGGDDTKRINGVSRRSLFFVDFILRLLAIASTFSAAIVMGTNKQMVTLPIVGPLSAKYQYSPAFVYVMDGVH